MDLSCARTDSPLHQPRNCLVY